ncbi:MAG: peptide chain release factor N(5)-glutamine methyltransferase [Candidatus Kapabacteria bacterium]|nr:peptide chain release factor N(5)-glutamine methyltransferase [Candidatus Kapabacteria bacterium]
MGDKVWTIIELIRWGSDYFKTHNIESPRLTIELLLGHVLGYKRIDLYASFDQPMKDSELKKLREYVLRRKNNEPLQYIIGSTPFLNFELICDKRALIPRPETEQLAEIIQKKLNTKKVQTNILDIGTGSGCLAIAAALGNNYCKVHAIDISNDSLSLAQENATKNLCINIVFENVDILKQIPALYPYDLIISNPPYISESDYKELQPELCLHEPRISLSDESDGLRFYRHFAEVFKKILKPEGEFFLEIGYGHSIFVKMIFEEKKYHIDLIKDYSGIDRFVHGSIKREISF